MQMGGRTLKVERKAEGSAQSPSPQMRPEATTTESMFAACLSALFHSLRVNLVSSDILSKNGKSVTMKD
jgi:hypothetical protein